MTRPEALVALRRLALGLPPGSVEEQASRVVERLAAHADTEELRAALIELGAAALVRGPDRLAPEEPKR